jgi:hypothetical protein
VSELVIREHTLSTLRNIDSRPWEVPELGIQERPPSTLISVNDGPLGVAGARDPGAPTINVKKRRWQAPWEVPELEIR